MSFAPIASASLAVQLHAAAATIALVLGAAQLLRSRGDAPHRVLGWIWLVAMATAAASSFFVHEIRMVLGLFSPIHLISIFTLAALPRAIWYARQGLVRKHRRTMTRLFWFGLVLPGALTLVPGRLLHRAVFASGQGATVAVLSAEQAAASR